MNVKKPRKESIYGRTKEKTSKIKLSYDQSSGDFKFHDAEPGSIRTERSYSRDSGKDKILSAIFSGTDSATFEIDEVLKKTFTYVLSIDTNSKLHKGKKISICTCYSVPGKLRQHGHKIPFNHLVSYLILNPQPDINPETLGWSLIIKHNLKICSLNEGEKIALIVDSEKDSLESFNNKKQPYFADYFLPGQVYFAYASDKGKDTLPGQMIKMCDNFSNQIARELLTDDFVIPELKNKNNFHDGYCELIPVKER